MLADLLKQGLETDLEEIRENERTATPVRAFTVRLHETGYSLREKQVSCRYRALNALTEDLELGASAG